MSEIGLNKEYLSKEIEAAFPFVDMPDADELVLHDAKCFECRYLREDLEAYRGKEITGEAIRLVHQELSSLSAKGLKWILPHYLRFCLIPEAEYNRMETEFLIYHFGPSARFRSRVIEQLSCLNAAQMCCLIHFFEWCLAQPYWREYCPHDLENTIDFLRATKKLKPESVTSSAHKPA